VLERKATRKKVLFLVVTAAGKESIIFMLYFSLAPVLLHLDESFNSSQEEEVKGVKSVK